MIQLGGLHERNDGNCYVPRQNSSGLPVDYQMWDVFDYPSVGQVQAMLRENDIILIIASRSVFQPTYEVYLVLTIVLTAHTVLIMECSMFPKILM